MESEKKSASVSLKNLESSGTTLLAHIWEQRSGAMSLLAAGSRVSDRFTNYVKTSYAHVSLLWSASQPLVDFQDLRAQLSFNGSTLNASIPNTWAATKVINEGASEDYLLEVSHIYKEAELARFEVQEIRGEENALELVVRDTMNQPAPLRAEFAIEIDEKRRRPGSRPHRRYYYREVFDGMIPERLVERQGDLYILKIGQLDFTSRAKDDGSELRIDLVSTHKLNGQSKSKEADIKHEIGGDTDIDQ